jgi:ankyrin repeat protein
MFLNYVIAKPSVLKHLSSLMQQQDLMDICRHGSESIKAFSNVNFSKLRDESGNTCTHEASRYGNLRILKYLSGFKENDFNALNNNHETPLTYSLKNNLRNY